MDANQKPPDPIRDEFLAEAQDLIEALSRDLLLLDAVQKQQEYDPDLVQEIFRSVHTLKGIAGMFGYGKLSALSHALEDLLDDLRMGRVDLSTAVLDVLFNGVQDFQRLLAEVHDPHNEVVIDFEYYVQSIEGLNKPKSTKPPTALEYDLDPNLTSILTEYEEQRLRFHLEEGHALFRLRVVLELASIDRLLDELRAAVRPFGEVITYLPVATTVEPDKVELDVLIASAAAFETIAPAVSQFGGELYAVAKKLKQDFSESAPIVTSGGGTAVTHLPPENDEVFASLPASKEPEAMDISVRSVTNTVRVDIAKLDHLMNVVGDLAIVRTAVARMNERLRRRVDLRPLTMELHRIHREFERRLEELQTGILDVRMVPLSQLFDKLGRVVRQVARDYFKEVRWIVSGADTQLDKLIVEELSDPLMHVIRNAIDHGIETPEMREMGGKPLAGTLSIHAYQKGNHVVVEVSDDGAGIDEEKLVENAIQRGLVTQEAAREMTRLQMLDLMFLPGLSTRDVISDISGRGVGMDVVKTNIARLGGVIEVQSEWNLGTRLTITLPITLAIFRALIVDVAGRTFAVPLSSVQEVMKLDAEAVRTVEGHEMLSLRGSTLPLCRLSAFFGLTHSSLKANKSDYVVVTELGTRRLGFVVDGLEGQEDIVIKPLGQSLHSVRGFAGATDLGDQRVVLILDAPSLLEEILAGSEHAVLGAVA